ncbi:MAG TPA: dihydrolipoyl dehydrogenase [Prolixibacteraceae bacterium]|nr:dihydrolipoyl dehydrogenase [Prolixibacteraceae bacterium]
MSEKKKHELVIIGAGPGGYRAAFMAADLGLKVTLIDPEKNPGCVCLYRGCIPTKALLHLSKIKRDAEGAGEMGLNFTVSEVDVEKLAKWKNNVVKKLTGGLGQLVKARKINYIRGRAEFIDSGTLRVKSENNKEKKLTFKHAIIATGAKPVSLQSIETDGEQIVHSAAALNLENIPGKMLIIGGGYIGLEMATIYQALNTEISIVELTSNFLPGTDKDLISAYKKENKNSFKDIFLETKVTKVKKNKNKVKVEFEDKSGKKFSKEYDKILVSVGQQPNTENLGLDNTSVERDEKGFIKVNAQQQTSEKGIFAIGDIAGPPLLAHKASYEGRVAAEVIAGKKAANDTVVIPAVIYTDPEIATCGLNEAQAKEKGIDYKVVKFPWSASGRAVAMNSAAGFTKLLIHKKNERILGAGIVGAHAGDMIAELALAIEMAATAEDVALTIHPHPTLSETIMEAAELFYGHPAHTISKK